LANERTFVTTLMKAIEKAFPDGFVWKPVDSFNLGVPDIHAVMSPTGRFLVAEVKQVPKLYDDGLELSGDPGRSLLRHGFTGPQISMLRRLRIAGAEAYGIVRTNKDRAYVLDPQVISLEGKVTPRVLHNFGRVITRENGWKFWT